MSKAEYSYSASLAGKVIHSADEDSSVVEQPVESETTISRLSSERGMSPANEATPTGSSVVDHCDNDDQSQSTN